MFPRNELAGVLLLEAVQRALFLLLVLVEFGHALLQRLPGALSADAHLSLFFDRLQAGAGVGAFLAQADKLVLEALTLLAPILHLRFRPVCRRFQVNESLLQGRRELFLREEVLFDGSNACLLLFDDL